MWFERNEFARAVIQLQRLKAASNRNRNIGQSGYLRLGKVGETYTGAVAKKDHGRSVGAESRQRG